MSERPIADVIAEEVDRYCRVYGNPGVHGFWLTPYELTQVITDFSHKLRKMAVAGLAETAQLREQLGRVETILTVYECRTIEETPGDANKLAILLRRALGHES